MFYTIMLLTQNIFILTHTTWIQNQINRGFLFILIKVYKFITSTPNGLYFIGHASLHFELF